MDLIGIEPMTSSMPWKRAPSCATGPLRGGTYSLSAKHGSKSNQRRLGKPQLRQTAHPAWLLAFGHKFDFEDLRPLFACHKQPVVLFVVSDPIQHGFRTHLLVLWQ